MYVYIMKAIECLEAGLTLKLLVLDSNSMRVRQNSAHGVSLPIGWGKGGKASSGFREFRASYLVLVAGVVAGAAGVAYKIEIHNRAKNI